MHWLSTAWLLVGAGKATEAASDRSSLKLLLRPAEPSPDGCDARHVAGPIRELVTPL